MPRLILASVRFYLFIYDPFLHPMRLGHLLQKVLIIGKIATREAWTALILVLFIIPYDKILKLGLALLKAFVEWGAK